MSNALDRLNLRPFERRLLVGVGLALFLVLNFVFVWPHFSDRGTAINGLENAKRVLTKFEREIAQTPDFEAKIKALESASEPVPQEDQITEFQLAITRQSSQSGVTVSAFGRVNTRTNDPFFLEQNQTISIVSEEGPLLDFLYQLGTGSSMIRVRGFSLRPDAPRQRLTGNIILVASYQKKPPVKKATETATVATNKPARTLPPTNRPAVKAATTTNASPPAKR